MTRCQPTGYIRDQKCEFQHLVCKKQCTAAMWIDIRPGSMMKSAPMSAKTPEFSIAVDFDRKSDISADSDPMVEYLSYLAYVQDGLISDMGFTLRDFRRYIAGSPGSGTRL